MKSINLILCVCALAMAPITSAFADGAVAVGAPTDIARNGVAIGVSTDMKSASAARNDALSQCKASDVKGSTRVLCKVVKTFTNQCAAIALDPRPGTPGFGWAVAVSDRQASSQALASCNATAGDGRRGWCKVVGKSCDG